MRSTHVLFHSHAFGIFPVCLCIGFRYFGLATRHGLCPALVV